MFEGALHFLEREKKQWFCWSSGMVNYSGTVSCIIQIAGRMKEKWWLQYFPPYQAMITIRGTLGEHYLGRWANHKIWFFHSFLNPMMFNSEVSTSWTDLPTCQWCCRNPANRLDVWNPLQNGKSNYCITWCRISCINSIINIMHPNTSGVPFKTLKNSRVLFKNPFKNIQQQNPRVRKHHTFLEQLLYAKDDPETQQLSLPRTTSNKRTSSWKVLEINGFKLIFPLATMASARG